MRFINCIDINKKGCSSFSATHLGQEESLVSGEVSVYVVSVYVVLYFHSKWLACPKSITFFFQFQKNKPRLKICYNTSTHSGHCT
jgi:hypothetical protein